MKIIRVKNQIEGAEVAFEILKEKMINGAKTLGLATGSSPLALYNKIVSSELDFSDMTSINLDEYVGLDKDHPQSYHTFMQEKLFSKKPFKNQFIPDGQAGDLTRECERYERILAEYPIDVQLLGIGRNGHIGFNEPGTSFSSRTHLVDLAENTIEANSRFFADKWQVPRQALSMGIASILSAKTIILLAYGDSKVEAIYQTVHGQISEQVPATCLQNHSDVYLIVDEAAASKLD